MRMLQDFCISVHRPCLVCVCVSVCMCMYLIIKGWCCASVHDHYMLSTVPVGVGVPLNYAVMCAGCLG